MTHNLAAARQRMLENDLRGRGIRDSRVLAAMSAVPRELFVEKPMRQEAYDDTPLPIGFEQTISQPYTVAFMAEALGLTGTEKVLEIGTGSGYGAAVLSRLVEEVHTIERIAPLAHRAEHRFEQLGFDNVRVHIGDGSRGLPDEAPFDAICVTAAARSLPEELIEQLAPGGRLLIPIGLPTHSQRMTLYTRDDDDTINEQNLGDFVFVPLIRDST